VSLLPCASGCRDRCDRCVGEIVSQYGAKVFAVQGHANSAALAQTDTVAMAHSVQDDLTRLIRLRKRVAWQSVKAPSAYMTLASWSSSTLRASNHLAL
jgi:hypothetical protein